MLYPDGNIKSKSEGGRERGGGGIKRMRGWRYRERERNRENGIERVRR